MSWPVRKAYGIDVSQPGERAGHFKATDYYNNWGEVGAAPALPLPYRKRPATNLACTC